MKKNPQGKRWHRLDNTGKIFPMIANENLSNVFRISVTLKEEIDPGLWDRHGRGTALVPEFKVKQEVFWYYFRRTNASPLWSRRKAGPAAIINPQEQPTLPVPNAAIMEPSPIQVFHAVTDGMGAVNFLKELTAGYLELKRGGRRTGAGPGEGVSTQTEDSYLKNYRKMQTRRYSSRRRCALLGDIFPLEGRVWSTGTRTQGSLRRLAVKWGSVSQST